MKQVACPVALHPDGTPRRLAMYEGAQGLMRLVTGPITAGGHPEASAARELFDQAGLETQATMMLGTKDMGPGAGNWHFVLCRIKPPVRMRWQQAYRAAQSQLRRFGWVDLDAMDEGAVGEDDLRALHWIKDAL